MKDFIRFPYSTTNQSSWAECPMPILPLTLARDGVPIETSGLLDTGSSVNVLPYSQGVLLGLDWDVQRIEVTLTGNLARYPAKAVIVDATVATFAPVRLAFAWTRSDTARLILGQANFFMEFDACFYRSQLAFELRPAS